MVGLDYQHCDAVDMATLNGLLLVLTCLADYIMTDIVMQSATFHNLTLVQSYHPYYESLVYNIQLGSHARCYHSAPYQHFCLTGAAQS